MRSCAICRKGLLKKQKKCCSIKCQSELTRRRLTKPRVKKKCVYCFKLFETVRIKQKYCCRACVDLHKKITYIGNKNPAYGKKLNEEQISLKRDIARKNYYKYNLAPILKKGTEEFFKEKGVYPSNTPSSKNKRSQTFLKKYGVGHNWSDEHIRNKCEKTCLDKYGKHSWQIAFDHIKKKSTNIEKIIESILNENKIKFKKHCKVYYNDKKYKVYDFHCIDYNVLIEADGDYWHANPKYYFTLNETQKRNKNNDFFKTKLAKEKKYFLLRFYEDEICDINFYKKLLKEINKYEKIQS